MNGLQPLGISQNAGSFLYLNKQQTRKKNNSNKHDEKGIIFCNIWVEISIIHLDTISAKMVLGCARIS